MCEGFVAAGATGFLLDHRDGLGAAYDRPPTMDYRMNPALLPAPRVGARFGPAVVHEDLGPYDWLGR
jgi:hypothetical protein